MKNETLYHHQDWLNLVIEFFTAKATNPEYYQGIKSTCSEYFVKEGISPTWDLFSKNTFRWFIQDKKSGPVLPENFLDLILKALTEENILIRYDIDSKPVYTVNDKVAKYLNVNGLMLNKIFGFEYIAETYISSVFKIENHSKNEISIGNGFLINHKGKNVIITNSHVLEKAEKYIVKNYTEVKIEIADTYNDSKNDITILVPKDSTQSSTPFYLNNDIRVLAEILTIGYPPVPFTQESYPLFHLGEINSFVKSYSGHQLFLFSAKTNPGNSGSPIIDSKGTVVGIVTQQLEEQDGYKKGKFPYYAAIPSSEIIRFIESQKF